MRFILALAVALTPVLAVPKLKHLSATKHILVLDDACSCSPSSARSGKCDCPDDDRTDHSPQSDPDDTVSVPSAAPTTPPVTMISDLTLLSLYKGHDASDRDGVADYGDVINDFRQGWSLWPTSTISFLVDDSVGNCARSTLAVAVASINSNVCVHLAEQDPISYATSQTKSAVLHITTSAVGCFASLGFRPSGDNVVNIGSGCVNVGTVIHLLLHSIGLFHEHQRADRDGFVQTNSFNINSARTGGNVASNKFSTVFAKADARTLNAVWVNASTARPYDYSSIMHNGPCHYSLSEELGGGPTQCLLEPTINASAPADVSTWTGEPTQIGNRGAMSAGDATLVNALYRCGPPVTVAPALADAITPETTMCTLTDAASFAWTEKALAGAAVVKANLAVTTAPPAQNPNELQAFKDFLRTHTSSRLLFIIIGIVCGLMLIAAAVGLFLYKQRQSRRAGLKAAVEQPPPGGDSLPSVPLLAADDKDTGDSTDSEVYAEIMEADIAPDNASTLFGPSGTAPARGSEERV